MNTFQDDQYRSPDSPVLLAFGTDGLQLSKANNNEEHGLEQTHSLFKHLSAKSRPAKLRFPLAKTYLTSGGYSVVEQKQNRGQPSEDVALRQTAGRREKKFKVRREARRRELEGAPDPNIAPANSSFTAATASPVSPVSPSNGRPFIRTGLMRSDQDWNIRIFGKDRVIANAEMLHSRLEEIAPDYNASSTEEWTLSDQDRQQLRDRRLRNRRGLSVAAASKPAKLRKPRNLQGTIVTRHSSPPQFGDRPQTESRQVNNSEKVSRNVRIDKIGTHKRLKAGKRRAPEKAGRIVSLSAISSRLPVRGENTLHRRRRHTSPS